MATKPRILKPLPIPSASTPAAFTLADAEALHAIAEGRAEPEQQKRALKWVIDQACGASTWAYRDSQRDTDLALGRQFVAAQIQGLLKLNLSELRRQHADS